MASSGVGLGRTACAHTLVLLIGFSPRFRSSHSRTGIRQTSRSVTLRWTASTSPGMVGTACLGSRARRLSPKSLLS